MPRNSFYQKINAAIEESINLGYNPIAIRTMLSSSDAVSVAKKLVTSGEIQSGLKHWARKGRRDLTMEGIMLLPEFSSLFSQAELNAALWRIGQAQQP
ncbi:hypothetical protein FMZ60_08810 [Alcaligenaceae bacterium SJ-26]|nr:hypothetical protein FMZ60_08810 [Alcaligenaceae bacterium SJ-26]